MKPEQIEALWELGWKYDDLSGPKWKMKLYMVLQCRIKAMVPHKEELWHHIDREIDAMDDAELRKVLRSQSKIAGLSAAIMFRFR